MPSGCPGAAVPPCRASSRHVCGEGLFSFDRVRFVTHLIRTLIPMTDPAFIPDDFFKVLAPSDIFGTDGPFEVDLGCGDGGFLLQMAAHYPERRFLGIERLLGRVRGVCSRAAVRGLENVKVLRVESRYFLEWMVRPGCVSRLHYLCPDPWPKERHHKNRLRSISCGCWTMWRAAACSAGPVGRMMSFFIPGRISSFNGSPWENRFTAPASLNCRKPDSDAFYTSPERFLHGCAPGHA